MIVSPEAGSPVPPHGGRHQCHVLLPVVQRPPGNCGHSAAEDLQPGLHPFQQDLRSHQTVASRRHRGKSRGHPEASCRQNSRRYAHGDLLSTVVLLRTGRRSAAAQEIRSCCVITCTCSELCDSRLTVRRSSGQLFPSLLRAHS